VGVGVELSVKDGKATIIRVIEGGPAHAAGLQAGAVLLQVAGENIQQQPLPELVNLLRGPPQSTVKVRVEERGKSYDVTLVRKSLVKTGGSARYTAEQADGSPR